MKMNFNTEQIPTILCFSKLYVSCENFDAARYEVGIWIQVSIQINRNSLRCTLECTVLVFPQADTSVFL